MCSSNGTFYTEDHLISYVNAWSDWHLIPSSRFSILHHDYEVMNAIRIKIVDALRRQGVKMRFLERRIAISV